MPLALLLSPDDQAVSAITAVLEEMSVTCERPLDGVSAAHKLSSSNFDLVLVDCENLPAAKLIFDVCRRGKGGNHAVPIAIVDGRAGLPTAFRLGAELILTKPVAKDQARNTIRSAVSRVKKDDVQTSVAGQQVGGTGVDALEMNARRIDASMADASLADASLADASLAGPSHAGPSLAQSNMIEAADIEASPINSNQTDAEGSLQEALPHERAMAAVAGVSSQDNLQDTPQNNPQLTSYSDNGSSGASFSATAVTPGESNTVTLPAMTMNAAATPQIVSDPFASEPTPEAASGFGASDELSDDPVLAELEMNEANAAAEKKLHDEAASSEAQDVPAASSPVVSQAPAAPHVVSSVAQITSRVENKQSENKRSESKAKPTRGSLVAVFALVVVGAAFYAAWVYEPGFRALAQPQIDRVLALAGIAHPTQKPAPVATPVKSSALAKPSPVAANQPAGATSQPAAANSNPDIAGSDIAGANPATTAASTAAPSASSAPNGVDAVNQTANVKPAVGKAESDKSLTKPNESGTENSADAKNPSALTTDEELLGEKTAIILSSKGAENRLIHSVQPSFPTAARPAEGTIVLKAVIDETGTVTGARVVEGNPALAKAAVSAVRQWRYRPYVRDGKAMSFQTVVLLDFQKQ